MNEAVIGSILNVNLRKMVLLHDNEIFHDVKAVPIRLQSQLLSIACADLQVAILTDTSHCHLLITTATQLYNCIAVEKSILHLCSTRIQQS